MSIKLVVFDIAGTTIRDNDDVNKVLRHTLAEAGISVSREDVNEVMGYPKPEAIKLLVKKSRGNGSDPNENYILQLHSQFRHSMINHYRNNGKVMEKTGVSETFKKLRERNIKIGIDTGFDREITTEIFLKAGWKEGRDFDASVTSDEVDHGRPFPDMIFLCMELAEIADSKEVAKVGDTVSDLQQGKAAGCGLVIGITTGAGREEELKMQNPDYLVREIPEILDFIF